MFITGIIVFIIVIFSIIKGVIHRVQAPIDDFKKEISTLKKRIDELENQINK